MDVIFMIFLAAFGMFGGMFIGAGNRCGIFGAVVCGVLTGVVLNLPFLSDGDRVSNVVLFLGAVAGALIINFVPAGNGLKRRFLTQKGLRINFGAYYRLGCG